MPAEEDAVAPQLLRSLIAAAGATSDSDALWRAVERSCSACLQCICACHQLQQDLAADDATAAAAEQLLCRRATSVAESLSETAAGISAAADQAAAAEASGAALFALLEALVFHRLLRDDGASSLRWSAALHQVAPSPVTTAGHLPRALAPQQNAPSSVPGRKSVLETRYGNARWCLQMSWQAWQGSCSLCVRPRSTLK